MTYLTDKHSRFLASLEKPPVMPINHSPADLNALADHFLTVATDFREYVTNIAREAHACGLIDISPELTGDYIWDAVHDCDLAQAIRAEAERMVERQLEDA